MSKFSGDSPEEISSRLTASNFSLSQARELSTGFKRIHTAMTRIAVAERKQQIALIKGSIEYLNKEVAPLSSSPKTNAAIRVMRNELISLAEGIRANAVSQEDMCLTSGMDAVRAAETLVASLSKEVEQLRAGITYVAAGETPQAILHRNAKYKALIPDLKEKDYGVVRVPVTFSIMPDSGHTRVGYLDTDMLSHLGFKATLLDGYAVIEKQVVLGISRSMLIDGWKDTVDGDGKAIKEAIPKMVKERVTKFTNDKPGMATKKRPKSALDAAREVQRLLESHTNTKYEMVSERSYGYQGNSYFWLMPAKDLARFSRAFPGGHVRMHQWGFAF